MNRKKLRLTKSCVFRVGRTIYGKAEKRGLLAQRTQLARASQ